MRNLLLVCSVLGIAACSQATASESQPDPDPDLPAVFGRFSSAVSVSRDGDYVVLRATAVPDHGSPYFPQGDSRYEAYNGTNPSFQLNPNRIQAQNLVMRIPISPRPASTPQATSLGPIGLALNGVPIFNQYAGPNRPLTNEVNSFDQYNGHPQQTGVYHYHVEPVSLTRRNGGDSLIGFLLDGYPVYGPVENGRRVANADLDALHGHAHATADFPGGTYHYHVTDQDPYINGAGYYGTPGTLSQ